MCAKSGHVRNEALENDRPKNLSRNGKMYEITRQVNSSLEHARMENDNLKNV